MTLTFTSRSTAGAIHRESATSLALKLRDNNSIYGLACRRQVAALGIYEVTTAPRSPRQNPYVERVIGSIRRESLDHMIVLGRRHQKTLLGNCIDYYHSARTHLSLDKDTPHHRQIQSHEHGTVIELRRVYGFHHEYVRMATGIGRADQFSGGTGWRS